MKTINIKKVIEEIEKYKSHAENCLNNENDPIFERHLSGEIAAYNAVLNIIKDNMKESEKEYSPEPIYDENYLNWLDKVHKNIRI
jgi:hypothetical protein